ncbi:uncharacterized protein LOC143291046 [Babylonia areolata]|uniref:uncharacterized protein LOC143291046 n=1 Tax=Babylonia areolata TaxID=304850 RepID=UPI003FD6A427
MEGKRNLVCVLLFITGISAADIARTKRETDSLGDMMDNAEEAVKNLADKAKDMADNAGEMSQDMVKAASDMAKDIMDKTGFDVKDLPQDLMQTASKLSQMLQDANGPFQEMLKNVQGQMEGNVSMDDVTKNYEKLLTNADFVKETKDLMQQHDGNTADPQFKTGMEKVMLKYLQEMGGAHGLTASVLCVLLAVIVHLEFL